MDSLQRLGELTSNIDLSHLNIPNINLPSMPNFLFAQSLQDLVKGIRAHRRDEETYIQLKITECLGEARQNDPATKANAILKLVYLQMFGFPMSSVSFHIVEVLSRPEFVYKRIGYLAAAESFSPSTDVLLLTTNQFKKDFSSGKSCDTSLALAALARVSSEDLGRECFMDIVTLMGSTHSYIRKKSIIVALKVVQSYPDALRDLFPKIRERFDDPDPSVVCAAITVLCELAKVSPRSYLPLAPLLYEILVSSNNNWVLIKVVKIFCSLAPVEPRLAKKLVDPITNIMQTTRAKSLLYECCNTVSVGLTEFPDVTKLCAAKLGEFIIDSDQNLKYLGLLAMRRLAKISPALASQHRDLTFDCLDDEDLGIRLRALDLVSEFITHRNMREVSRILLAKLEKASLISRVVPPNPEENETVSFVRDVEGEKAYRDALSERLLSAGAFEMKKSGGVYTHLESESDFNWYVQNVLFGLAKSNGLSAKTASVVAEQLLQITGRVVSAQETAVKVACAFVVDIKKNLAEDVSFAKDVSELLDDAEVEMNGADPTGAGQAALDPLLNAFGWIVGEHPQFVERRPDIVLAMFDCVTILTVSPKTASNVIQAALKVFASSFESNEEFMALLAILKEHLPRFVVSFDSEVQERAAIGSGIVDCIIGSSSPVDCRYLFEGELKPVDPRVQARIQPPAGLDLNEALVSSRPEVVDDDLSVLSYDISSFSSTPLQSFWGNDVPKFEKKDIMALVDDRETKSYSTQENKSRDPFYLGNDYGRKQAEQPAASEAASASTKKSEYTSIWTSAEPASQGVSNRKAVIFTTEVPSGLNLSDEEAAGQNPEAAKEVKSAKVVSADGAAVKKKLKKKKKTKAGAASTIDDLLA